jgi:hypothetical protein
VGRGASKAARLNSDGRLITGYYDLPKTSASLGAPGHNTCYQDARYLFTFSLLLKVDWASQSCSLYTLAQKESATENNYVVALPFCRFRSS